MNCPPFCVNEIPDRFLKNDLKPFLSYLAECLGAHGLSDFEEISITFVNEEEISELNQQYYGSKGSTDILSFCLGEPDSEIPILGDIYLYPEAFQNEFGLSSDSELLNFLISHGVLHLLGWTHETVEDFDRMIAIQKALVQRIPREQLEVHFGS